MSMMPDDVGDKGLTDHEKKQSPPRPPIGSPDRLQSAASSEAFRPGCSSSELPGVMPSHQLRGESLLDGYSEGSFRATDDVHCTVLAANPNGAILRHIRKIVDTRRP
jgi:hypothetical protein